MLQTPWFRLLAGIALLFGLVAAVAFAAPRVLRSLPYQQPSRIVADLDPIPYSPASVQGQPLLSFAEWQQGAHSFERMAAFHEQYFYLARPDATTARLPGGRASYDFFSVLGAKPAFGRLFTADDYEHGRRVVVIGDGFWKNELHSAGNAIGSHLSVDGGDYEVIGITQPDFWFLSRDIGFWVLLPSRPNYFVNTVARLRAGVTRSQAEGEARVLRAKITHAAHVDTHLISLQEYGRTLLRITLFAAFILLLAAMAAASLYVWPLLRSEHPWRTWLRAAVNVWSFLVVKAVVLLIPVAAFWLVVADRFAPDLGATWFSAGMLLLAWPFLLIALGAIGWSFLDQNRRCPLCLNRLRMPLEVGSWSSLVVDRPGTEYICPYGHGKLFVPGTRLLSPGSTRWTSYRDIWSTLFSESSK